MNQRIPDFPPEYDFLVHCCAAISRQDYKAALQSLKKGLARNLKQFNEVNGVELMKHFQAVVCVLERHLRHSYGYEWEQTVKIPRAEVESKVLRCSFCDKVEGEVAKVIVGPSVSICDECVSICNEVLRDATVAAASSSDGRA